MKLLSAIKDADYYLNCVRDWEDPNPAPVLKDHMGITVVRDDLLDAGSKVRFIDHLISRNLHVEEWVYGSSPRWGYGQISLAAVCKKYGKKCTLFLAKSKVLHPNSEKAVSYGAEVRQVVGGVMKICEAAAKKYVQERPGTARLVPFGLADDSVYGSIIKVARNLPINPGVIVTVAGSGVLNRGLQMAWPDAEAHMLQVGHKITEGERGRAFLYIHDLPFQKQCLPHLRPTFPSVPEYDAKGWAMAQFVRTTTPPEKKVLFWNVAGPVESVTI